MLHLLRVLAAYRLAYLIANERGPFDAGERLRSWVEQAYGADSWQSEGINCPLCISFWLAFVLLLCPDWLIAGLGTAGGVLVVHRSLEAADAIASA